VPARTNFHFSTLIAETFDACVCLGWVCVCFGDLGVFLVGRWSMWVHYEVYVYVFGGLVCFFCEWICSVLWTALSFAIGLCVCCVASACVFDARVCSAVSWDVGRRSCVFWVGLGAWWCMSLCALWCWSVFGCVLRWV